MASYEIRPLQLRIFEILKAVDKVCKDHNLRYYCWAGTMLGAVRHKGFIPWDDDMDIAMPRHDYDLFMQNAKDWLPKPYEAVCAETDVRYPFPFGKIQDGGTTLIERKHIDYLGGIYIDVFPLDGVPENVVAQSWHFAKYEYYKRILYFIHRDPFKHGHGPSSWLPLLSRKLYTKASVQDKLRKIMKRYKFDDCRCYADYDDGKKGITPKEILGTPSPYLFEGCTVNGVENAEKYLSGKYGDYMTIPNHDNQRQHNFYFLSYDLSYHDYKDERDF